MNNRESGDRFDDHKELSIAECQQRLEHSRVWFFLAAERAFNNPTTANLKSLNVAHIVHAGRFEEIISTGVVCGTPLERFWTIHNALNVEDELRVGRFNAIVERDVCEPAYYDLSDTQEEQVADFDDGDWYDLGGAICETFAANIAYDTRILLDAAGVELSHD